jgi:hypothetical protein
MNIEINKGFILHDSKKIPSKRSSLDGFIEELHEEFSIENDFEKIPIKTNSIKYDPMSKLFQGDCLRNPFFIEESTILFRFYEEHLNGLLYCYKPKTQIDKENQKLIYENTLS